MAGKSLGRPPRQCSGHYFRWRHRLFQGISRTAEDKVVLADASRELVTSDG
jgi:hypothetical protein